MDQIVAALRDILTQSIPTILIVLLLHFYLKAMFFKPLSEVLKKRYEATSGTRHGADESLRHIEQKAAAYDSAIQSARLQLYREQEEHRMRRQTEQAVAMQAARDRAAELIEGARAQLTEETKNAAHQLVPQSEALAAELTQRILRGKAA